MKIEELRNKAFKLYDSGHPKEAYKLLFKAGEQGDAISINDAGVIMQRLGEYEEAFDLYSIAAEHNVPVAFSNLGELYEEGLYVKKDVNKAIELYKKNIELGGTEGYWKMFNIYHTSQHGIKPNYKLAMEYLRKGARLEASRKDDSCNSIYDYSYCLNSGKHCKKDPHKSFLLIKKAYRKNIPVITHCLALHYFFGMGVKKDTKKGIALFKKAFDGGYDESYYILGRCFATGDHIKEDFVSAHYYLRKAMERNYSKAFLFFASICLGDEQFKYEYPFKAGINIMVAFNNMRAMHPDKISDEEIRLYNDIKEQCRDKIDFEQIETDAQLAFAKSQQVDFMA